MKIPDGYTSLDTFEQARQKYYEWDFKNRKKNELKRLYYKGVYTDNPYDNPEECIVIGYYDDTQLVIELQRSKQKVIIHRAYLKQMQNNNFRQNQPDESEQENDNDSQPQGKALHSMPDDYIVYDVETTGFSYIDDEIIDIAAVKVQNGVVVDEFQSLINPGFDIDRKIERLTGITNLMLSSAPLLQEVIPEFKKFVGNSILLGHNIETFDNHFLSTAYSKCNWGIFDNNYVDTLKICKGLYPQLKTRKLSQLVKFLELEQTEDFHRALSDCHFTQKCYERMKADIKENHPRIQVKPTPTKTTSKSSAASTPKYNPYPKHADLRKLESAKTDFDVNNPFYGKSCVFTGELQKYTREEAAQIIVDLGGRCENYVTKKTDYLILSATPDPNKKSSKQKTAEAYGVKIIPESVFYEMIKSE